MKKQKKSVKNLIVALLVIMLAGILPGCGKAEKTDDTTIRVGSLKGPTSLGLLSLMDKADKGGTENTYEFQMATPLVFLRVSLLRIVTSSFIRGVCIFNLILFPVLGNVN